MTASGFTPVTGVRSRADFGAATSEVLALCILPMMIWDDSSNGEDPFGRFLTPIAIAALALLVWQLVRRGLARRRWKPGAAGVVLVEPGRSRRRVRAELRGSLGVDPEKARQALKYPGTLLVRDVDALQAHVFAARLTHVGADARVVQP
jgi:hypothetical protein